MSVAEKSAVHSKRAVQDSRSTLRDPICVLFTMLDPFGWYLKGIPSNPLPFWGLISSNRFSRRWSATFGPAAGSAEQTELRLLLGGRTEWASHRGPGLSGALVRRKVPLGSEAEGNSSRMRFLGSPYFDAHGVSTRFRTKYGLPLKNEATCEIGQHM